MLKRLGFTELRLPKLLGAFGFSQIVQLLASTLRIPAIAESSSIEVLGAIFFWMNIQMWGSVLSAGGINVARIAAQRGLAPTSRSGITAIVRRTTLGLGLLITFTPLFVDTPVMLAGAGPTILSLLAAAAFAKNIGIMQGKDRVSSVFNATAVAAVLSLAVTLILTKSPFWHFLTPNLQVLLMSLVSLMSITVPLLFAWVQTRNIEFDNKGISQQPKNTLIGFVELAAVLPPAFVSGFDTLALAVTGNSSGIAEYGLVSRVGLITTVVVSALYVQLNNVAGKRAELRGVDLILDSIKLLALTLPFSFAFLFFASRIVTLLSSGSVSSTSGPVFAVFLTSLILPVWISCSASLASRDIDRQRLGKYILLIVLPSSIIFTLSGSFFLGTAGPFFASALTYALASLSAIWIFRQGMMHSRIGAKSNIKVGS